MCSAWGLITWGGMLPMFANLVAFSMAFATSFVGQYLWTFRCSRRWQAAVLRFGLISGVAFGANNLLLLTFLHVPEMDPAQAALSAALIIPVMSYLGNRFWALS